jgi:hypothetical protein
MFEAKKKMTTRLLPLHFFSFIVVTMNKATIVNLLPSPIFSYFYLKQKWALATSLLPSHYFSSIVFVANKVMTTSLLSLPFSFSFA